MSLDNNHSKFISSSGCDPKKTTSQLVVARGNPFSKLMIIGEAPGAVEEKFGKPFLGRSGKILDILLEDAGFSPSKDVYICNVVKSRPPKNRRPTKIEIYEALPWLLQQIILVDPLVIILAGSTAVETVLEIKARISNIRGNWIYWKGRLVMPLFHPSYLLRNPSKEKGHPYYLTRSDFAEVKKKVMELEVGSHMSNSYLQSSAKS